MGRPEGFEEALYRLRGKDANISQEANEIRVLDNVTPEEN